MMFTILSAFCVMKKRKKQKKDEKRGELKRSQKRNTNSNEHPKLSETLSANRLYVVPFFIAVTKPLDQGLVT